MITQEYPPKVERTPSTLISPPPRSHALDLPSIDAIHIGIPNPDDQCDRKIQEEPSIQQE